MSEKGKSARQKKSETYSKAKQGHSVGAKQMQMRAKAEPERKGEINGSTGKLYGITETERG